MKKMLFLSLAFSVLFALVSCDSGNTGDFRISLKLPTDDGVCQEFEYDDEMKEDYTYCINRTDQVLLSIYSKSNINEDYVYADRKLIRVDNNKSGKDEFTRSLKKGTYYRFFVEVTNANEKLKMTGGVDGIYYDDSKNYSVDIFLSAVGDFTRVVRDRKNPDGTALESYIDTDGAKGSAAATLKNGDIFMAGGYLFDFDEISKKAMIFDMAKLTSKEVKKLPMPLMDFVAAFVDDGTEKGKVVVGLGKTEDGSNNNQLWYYDPEKDTYNLLPEMIPGVEKAKAITIDGAAYIAGGCDSNGGTTGVYKVSFTNGTPNVELFANLKVGRCNHALADISDVEIDENGVKTVTPKFAVVGGSIDSKKEGAETPVTGENFIEIVSAGKVEPLSFSSRNGGDDSNLMKTGIIAPSATAITMDDREESEIVIAVAGGYLRDGEAEDEYNWVANPSLIVFSKNAAATKKNYKKDETDTGDDDPADTGDADPADTGDAEPAGDADPADTGDTEPADTGDTEPTDTGDTDPTDTGDTEPTDTGDSSDTGDTPAPAAKTAWIYDVNSSPRSCARPSMAVLGSEEKSTFKYAAVNCGTSKLERDKRSISNQVIFVLQVKRVKDSDLGIEVFSSSVKDTLMEGNVDGESDARMADGPVVSNGLGQVYALGGKYVYLVGSYAIP